MRIPCPHCGSRDVAEFVCRGQVSEDLHLRDNPAGPVAEHWYHAQGCRQWLVVTRNIVTHDILSVEYPR